MYLCITLCKLCKGRQKCNVDAIQQNKNYNSTIVTPIKGARSQKKSLKLAIQDSNNWELHIIILYVKNKGTNTVHHLMYQSVRHRPCPVNMLVTIPGISFLSSKPIKSCNKKKFSFLSF